MNINRVDFNMVENSLSLGFISLYLIMVLLCVIFKNIFLFTRGILSTHAWDVLLYVRQRGEGDSIAFHLRFLTHSVCQCDVT